MIPETRDRSLDGTAIGGTVESAVNEALAMERYPIPEEACEQSTLLEDE